MPARTNAALDVSRLPHVGFDTHSPLWWGNLLLLMIETTMFGILVASYFYLRQNFEEWPPPSVNDLPVRYHPYPGLAASSVNMALMALSCLPMALVDRASRRLDATTVKLGLAVCVVLGLVFNVLRYEEYQAIYFQWNDNAYASIVWMTLGTHHLHLATCTLEALVMLVWVLVHGLDEKHALDITTTAIYWYWVVGIWAILYVIVYWSPRMV